MTTSYAVTAKIINDRFQDNVSKGNAETYEFDFSSWSEDNDPVTSVQWTLEGGQAGIASINFADQIASALITFNESGKSLISVTASTAAGRVRKLWLEIYAKDVKYMNDDYGLCE